MTTPTHTNTNTSNPSSSSLGWLWGTIGALVLAVLVGVGVYFITGQIHQRQLETLVDQRVEERMAAMAQEPQGPPPATVKVEAVRKDRAQQRVMVVGRLQEVKRSVIASEVEGRVVELLTPAGREVVGGKTVIARVDSVWSTLAVEQAQADLASAQATANQSANDLKNYERLKARGSADPQELDDARAKAQADAANVLAYKAALHRAEETRKRVDIIAPFDGTVTAKLTEQGQWLDPGTAVVEIVSRGLIDAVIDVPEQYITQVGKGTEVELVIEALNEVVIGKVVAINPDGSNAARSYPVKVRIDDRAGLFKVGMSVTARVPIRQQQDYLVVPRDAVQYTDNGAQVWMSLVMPGSAPGAMPQAMPMDVDVLFGEGEVFAINPQPKVQGMDLAPGMEVVTEGAERLWPTRPLIVIPSGQGPAEAAGPQPAGDTPLDEDLPVGAPSASNEASANGGDGPGAE